MTYNLKKIKTETEDITSLTQKERDFPTNNRREIGLDYLSLQEILKLTDQRCRDPLSRILY